MHVGEDYLVAKQPPSLERYLQAAVTVEAPALHIAYKHMQWVCITRCIALLFLLCYAPDRTMHRVMHRMHSRSTTCCCSSSSPSSTLSPVCRLRLFVDADAAVDSSLLRRAPPSPLARSCAQEKEASSELRAYRFYKGSRHPVQTSSRRVLAM